MSPTGRQLGETGPGPYKNAHEIVKVSDPAVFGASSWLKLYDTPGQPAHDPRTTGNSVRDSPN
jgi:hypothetical protein